MNKKICIIGGGNLGTAIAEGVVKKQWTKAENIVVTRRKIHKIKYLESQDIRITKHNKEAVEGSDIIILAVKPYQIVDIINEIKSVVLQKMITVVSVVTGFSLQKLKTCFGGQVSIFRAMPNTAIAIAESMTCMSSLNADISQQDSIISLFDTLGTSILIDEKLMDAATVLGACGIAYTMRFIRAASQGGIQIGFDAQTSQKIVSQVVKGASSLLLEKETHPEKEIDKVTTPKGCTIAGLNEMEFRGFSASLIKGIKYSHEEIESIKKE